MFVINELDADGSIKCCCPDDETDREYEAEVLDSCIRVKCTKCDAWTDIPTDSLINAYEFLNATSLELKHHDGEKI